MPTSSSKKKSLPKAQTGYTMKDYAAQYPQNASDTLARANPMIGGIKHFGTGKQQANLEKAHADKYGTPKTGMKPARPPLTGTKLDADYMKQESDFKKGGSVKKKTTMKKVSSVKKKK